MTPPAQKAWRSINRLQWAAITKKSRQKHQESEKARASRWRRRNKQRITAYHRSWKMSSPSRRLSCNLRARISKAIHGFSKSESTSVLLGCDSDTLRQHLESQFKPGMSWGSYGDWHVDHIRPCARFDLSKPEEQRACFHYTNLQPLWAKENIAKGAK